ncbi:MAG: catalase [Lachnospiraceae bacterium]|nr:catalase [Lachnospiraceae bacterium]
MNLIGRVIGHFSTITKHRHQVIKHCFKAGIPIQGLGHDLSKYSPVEFFQGVKYFTGDRSPNEGERKEYGYSKAWLHHKGRNRHHFEYWTDYNNTSHKVEPVEMPDRYVAEMFCDRLAACKIYNKEKYKQTDALEYFNKRKGKRFIHQKTSDKIEMLLKMVAEKGEDETFKYIRNNLVKK